MASFEFPTVTAKPMGAAGTPNKRSADQMDADDMGMELSATPTQKKGKKGKEKDVSCKAVSCNDNSVVGFVHCGPHKRAKEAITADVFPPKRCKNRKADPNVQEEFSKVFGDRRKGYPGDNEKATKILDAFLEEFPDEESQPGKKRCPDNWLGKQLVRIGTRKSQADIDATNCMEWDLFFTTSRINGDLGSS